jgi:hypothetical protein
MQNLVHKILLEAEVSEELEDVSELLRQIATDLEREDVE